jgi:hypothetical protein
VWAENEATKKSVSQSSLLSFSVNIPLKIFTISTTMKGKKSQFEVDEEKEFKIPLTQLFTVFTVLIPSGKKNRKKTCGKKNSFFMLNVKSHKSSGVC